MSQQSSIDVLFATLRDTERTARERLLSGCANDAANIERFIGGPLQKARHEAAECLSGMGNLSDSNLARSILLEEFERIGTRCAEMIAANVDLRARARFKLYTEELAGIELHIAEMLPRQSNSTHRLLPKMFSVGHIEIDGFVPPAPSRDADVDAWIRDFRASITQEVRERIAAACERVLAQGLQRLGIIRARVNLAAHMR